MTTVTASHFVSRSSDVHSAAPSVDARTSLAHVGFRNQTVTHNGLRAVNKLDVHQSRAIAKAIIMKSAVRPSGTILCGTGANLVFVGAEVAPWSKTGGLGDVLGGLQPAMAANGHRVMTVSPRDDRYKGAWDTSVLVEIRVGDRNEVVCFFHSCKRGVDCVFLDHPIFLEKAALEAPRALNLNNSRYFSGPYGEDVIFIAMIGIVLFYRAT